MSNDDKYTQLDSGDTLGAPTELLARGYSNESITKIARGLQDAKEGRIRPMVVTNVVTGLETEVDILKDQVDELSCRLQSLHDRLDRLDPPTPPMVPCRGTCKSCKGDPVGE